MTKNIDDTVTESSVRYAMSNEEKLQRITHPFAYPLLKRLTEIDDVVRIPRVGVIVSDTALMRTILTDNHFGKTGKGSSDELWTPLLGTSGLINMDGREHGMLRQKLSPLFAPKFVNQMASEALDEPLRELGVRIKNGEEVDIAVAASEMSNLMICYILGVSHKEDEAAEKDMLIALNKISSFTGRASITKKRFSEKETKEFIGYIDDILVVARKIWRENNFTVDEKSVLARLKSYDLTESEMSGVVTALIVAGTETISSVIPRIIALIIDSGWLPTLQHDRSKLEAVIEEGLRVTVPSPVMIRNTKENYQLTLANGRVVQFKKDERVILANLMACQKIGDFDPDRGIPESARKIWFGAGPHYCIGMPLANTQINKFLNMFLDAIAQDDVKIISRTAQGKRLIPAYQNLIIQKGETL